MLAGTIIKNISNLYTVISDNIIYECIPKGSFRNTKETPLVGDECLIDPDKKQITKILPRKNELIRPRVANVDYALIITSLVKPDFDAYLLDKEITSIMLSRVLPLICFTKIDLLDNQEKYKQLKKYYESIGISCFNNQDLKPLQKFLQGKKVVLTGQSGAGKSTLLNKLDKNLNLKTDEISYSLNRGKHTTRHAEFYKINNIYFCDTPGFSSLDTSIYTKEEIKSTFMEFNTHECLYKDCLHLNENECLVKEMVSKGNILNSRYESYKKMMEENI